MSARFSTANSGEMTAYTSEDFEPRLRRLCGFLHLAIENDRAEVEYAKSLMKGFLFWDGYDAGATMEKFARLERDACNAMARAVGRQRAGGLPQPVDAESRIDALLETVYSVTANMWGAHKEWGGHAEALRVMAQEARRLTAGSWRGPAAEAYRRVAADCVVDAVLLEELSRCNQWAVEAVSFLQANIAEKLMQHIEDAWGKARDAYAAPMETEEIGDRVDKAGDSGAIHFDFYSRTLGVWNAVANLPNVYIALQNGDLDWQSSAELIRIRLEEAMAAVRQRRVGLVFGSGRLGLFDKENGIDDQGAQVELEPGAQNMEDSIF